MTCSTPLRTAGGHLQVRPGGNAVMFGFMCAMLLWCLLFVVRTSGGPRGAQENLVEARKPRGAREPRGA